MAKAPLEIRSLARSHTKSALNVLSGIMTDKEAPAPARVTAAQVLLDRGWGKATQPVSSDEDNPLKIIHEVRHTIIDRAGHTDSEDI
jgi:hypothetical protein